MQGLCDAVSGCYQASLPDGTGCSDDGDPCSRDVCSNGACSHDSTGVCMIASACYTDGDIDPAGSCRVCDSMAASDMWTDVPDGTRCPEVDSYDCTTSSCSTGECVAQIDDGTCLITGTCRSADEINPDNECQSCQPSVSAASWSNLPDGTTCSTGTCSSGSCGGSTDPCNPPGADQCFIDGECYAAGESNPDNGCQACDPSISQTSWGFSRTGMCDPGVVCASTGTCFLGYCYASVDAGSCYIAGSCYGDGERNPDNACEYCDAASSQHSWTADAGTCHILGQCYDDGDVNPGSECQVCDSNQSTVAWSIRPGYCRIAGQCYTTGDENPAEACQECDPSDSQTGWSDAPSSKVCSGTCTCHMGTCKLTGCTP
jgi:hypothetical protein